MALHEITAENTDRLREGPFPDSQVPRRYVNGDTAPSAKTPPRFRHKCLTADPAGASLRPLRLSIPGKG